MGNNAGRTVPFVLGDDLILIRCYEPLNSSPATMALQRAQDLNIYTDTSKGYQARQVFVFQNACVLSNWIDRYV